MADTTDTYTAMILIQAQQAMEDFAKLEKVAAEYKKQILEIQAISQQPLSVKSIKEGIIDADKVAGATTNMKALNIATKDLEKEERAAAKATKDLNNEMKNLDGGSKKAGSALSSLGTIGRFVFGSVLGITAVTALRAVVRYLQDAVKAGIDFSNTMFKMSASVKLLQNLGMEITFEDSVKQVRELEQEFGLFTTRSLMEAIATIQLLMRNFEFTQEQLKEVSRLSIALAITQKKDVSEAARELALFFSSGYAESLQRAGFAVNRVTVLHKAQEMGLVGLTQGYQQLTEPQRALAGYTLVMEQAGDLVKLANEAQEENFGKVQKLDAAYSKLKDTLGIRLLPVLADIAEVFAGALKAFTFWLDYLSVLQIELDSNISAAFLTAAGAVNIFWEALRGGKSIAGGFDAIIESFKKFKEEIKKETMAEVFPDVFDPLAEYQGSDTAGKLADDTEEIEQIIEELNSSIEDEERDAANRRREIWIDYFNDLEQLYIDHQRKMADIAKDLQRDLDDIETGRLQDIEDENWDYAQKAGEAAQEAADRRAEAEREYRDRELIAELRFQERLRQLKEGFLFDLEDAVRERDARQIIRLTRQYNMEREQIIREEEIAKKDRWLAYQRQLADIDRAKAERLSRLYAEHMERLREIDAQAERERQRAELEAQRKKEDEILRYEQEKTDRKTRLDDQLLELDRSLQDRINKIVEKLGKEYNVTVEKLNAIAAAYEATYGPGGRIARAFQYYLGLLAAMRGGGTPGGTIEPPPTPGHAEGGTKIVTRPTYELFGEAGPEAVSWTPLGRGGVNVGRTQGSVPAGMGGRGGNGKLLIQLNLDAGLQYQIVDQAMGELADVIMKIERARK